MPHSIIITWFGVWLFLTFASPIVAFSPAWNIHVECQRRKPSSFSSSKWSSSSSDDPVSRLPLMEAELASETDEDKKITLLESIDCAKTSAEFGIRSAQFQFYEAFTNQDIGAMKDVWSTAEDIRCVHPGMESLNGPLAVLDSFGQIFSTGNAFTIEPSRTRIDVSGQTALCSCLEKTPGGGVLECLNLYRREDGHWKMILHMASPIAVRRAPDS